MQCFFVLCSAKSDKIIRDIEQSLTTSIQSSSYCSCPSDRLLYSVCVQSGTIPETERYTYEFCKRVKLQSKEEKEEKFLDKPFDYVSQQQFDCILPLPE